VVQTTTYLSFSMPLPTVEKKLKAQGHLSAVYIRSFLPKIQVNEKYQNFSN